jgi:hypothetical protein
MIDRREFVALEEEYTRLQLAELLDDVDVSLSTLQARDKRLAEIEEMVGAPVAEMWVARAMEKSRYLPMCSGAKQGGL